MFYHFESSEESYLSGLISYPFIEDTQEKQVASSLPLSNLQLKTCTKEKL